MCQFMKNGVGVFGIVGKGIIVVDDVDENVWLVVVIVVNILVQLGDVGWDVVLQCFEVVLVLYVVVVQVNFVQGIGYVVGLQFQY